MIRIDKEDHLYRVTVWHEGQEVAKTQYAEPLDLALERAHRLQKETDFSIVRGWK